MEARRSFTAFRISRDGDPLLFHVSWWLKPATLFFLLAFWPIAQRTATCETVEEQVAAHFRAGQEALKQGELTRATEEFKKVLALDPNLVEARVNLGLAYHSLGEYSLAVSNLSTALRQRSDLAGPTIILGIDYFTLGEAEKAIPILQRALRLEPSNLEARRALARCHLSRADFRQAADEYRQLASLNPDKADAWFKLGHDYLDLAARLAFRGSQVYRGSPWGNRFLGDTLFQRNRWRDAADEYRQALAIEPGQPGLHVSLGQAYLHGGKLDEAEAEFHLELQRDAQSDPAWLGVAELQLAKGQAAAALEAVGKIWEVSPEFLALPQRFPTVELSEDAAKGLVADLQAAPAGAARDWSVRACGRNCSGRRAMENLPSRFPGVAKGQGRRCRRGGRSEPLSRPPICWLRALAGIPEAHVSLGTNVTGKDPVHVAAVQSRG